MAGFRSVREYAAAFDDGRTHFCAFRKVPGQASVANWWIDLSMAAGNPLPNYYATSPATAAVLDGNRGVFHGADKAPASMHLTEWGLVTPTAGLVGAYTLLDYLLYYPFIDGDDTDVQAMDNTVSLPRYDDGEGVMVMAVAVAPTTGSGTFTFNYINQDGIERTSPVQGCSTTAANIASIVTSQPAVANAAPGPFLALANGDRGVRSIVSVTFSVPNGGLLALVLAKPIAQSVIREINTACEVSYVNQRVGAPRIYDGAYLGFIMNCAATVAAGQLAGHLKFAWST
jgi:hypothetical protein